MSVESLRLLESKNPTRPYILVDLDSTVFEILPLLAAAIYERYGLDILKISANEKRGYWFPDWPEIGATAGATAFVHRLFRNPEIFRRAKPLPGAAEVLNGWRNLSCCIGVGTRRFNFPEIRKATYCSLEENGLGWLWKNIFWGVPKDKLAATWRADMVLDDYDRDLKGPAPIKILFGNYFWQGEPAPGILTAKNWLAADQIVRAAIMSHNIDTSKDSV